MGPSARLWGELWGDRPRDWAGTEEQQHPVYAAALEQVELRAGDRVLDVGCGTGVFLRMCADRGAEVTGLDASEPLLAIARGRVPEADLRHGDMMALPFADDTFDLVTGFTSFFFADDMVAALREAGRVARPGGPVVIEVFGAPERCELELVKHAVAGAQLDLLQRGGVDGVLLRLRARPVARAVAPQLAPQARGRAHLH